MKRKNIKVGNSMAVTMPSEFLQTLGWRDGTHVNVVEDAKRKRIMVTRAKKY